MNVKEFGICRRCNCQARVKDFSYCNGCNIQTDICSKCATWLIYNLPYKDNVHPNGCQNSKLIVYQTGKITNSEICEDCKLKITVVPFAKCCGCEAHFCPDCEVKRRVWKGGQPLCDDCRP